MSASFTSHELNGVCWLKISSGIVELLDESGLVGEVDLMLAPIEEISFLIPSDDSSFGQICVYPDGKIRSCALVSFCKKDVSFVSWPISLS